MDDKQILDREFETIVWGLLFILWGLTMLFDFLPVGFGIAGSGVILLGLNVARARNGIRTKAATTTIGILALLGGGLETASSLLPLPFELSLLAVCAILLIVLGIIVLARVWFRFGRLGLGGLH